MISNSPTWAEVLNALRAGIFRDLHVALPASVEKFDAATQLVDVKPQINGTVELEDGTTEQRPIPVITNVPVVFPGAGGFHITFPVAAGDTGLLVFADRSMDAWQSGGGDTAPVDLRRHHLSDAVFFPGLHPNNAAIPGGTDTSVITIGKDDGSADFAALASKVNARLDAIQNAFNAHSHHVSVTGTSVAQTGVTDSLIGAASGTNSTGSASVKVKG